MRDSIRELSAARNLHRWLRRAALSAIPLAGLAGCGKQCDRPDYDTSAQFDGGVPWASGSQHSPAECAPYCGPGMHDICYTIDLTGCVASTPSTVTCHYSWTFCYQGSCGRLPAGLRQSAPADQPSVVAAYLADAARLEGAAVLAFQALERELIAHRAPAHLVARARSAQRDEARHHAAMSNLAACFGAQVPAVEVEALEGRTLIEFAAENAVEGCVRETFGAAVAAYQGEWAGNRAVLGAMRSIAIDEAEHASLGWDIDAWARTRLRPGELARLETARDDAHQRLVARMLEPIAPELSAVLGLPDAPASTRLMTALAPLWS
jgi:hypothetical protein